MSVCNSRPTASKVSLMGSLSTTLEGKHAWLQFGAWAFKYIGLYWDKLNSKLQCIMVI